MKPRPKPDNRAQKIHGGQLEVRMIDGSRVDLLTNTHAFEIEKTSNWKEAIGQSLHYALLTDTKAGIILIMEDSTPEDHLTRLKTVIEAYLLPIEVFTIQNNQRKIHNDRVQWKLVFAELI